MKIIKIYAAANSVPNHSQAYRQESESNPIDRSHHATIEADHTLPDTDVSNAKTSVSLAAAPVKSVPQQSRPKPSSELLCIRFLKLHYKDGGLAKVLFKMLYRMIEMMTGIGYEVFIMNQSISPEKGSLAKVKWYQYCILEGCVHFDDNHTAALTKANKVAAGMPDLDDVTSESELGVKLRHWMDKLKTLHKPTGNDTRLFQLLQQHFDHAAYHPLEYVSSLKPSFGLEETVEEASEIHKALERLWGTVADADQQVIVLKEAFKEALHRPPICPPDAENPYTTGDMQTGDQPPEYLTAATYEPSSETSSVSPPLLTPSKFFSVVEESIARRGHVRASTFSDADYTTNARNESGVGSCGETTNGTLIGSRCKGAHVPRVFTVRISLAIAGTKHIY